MCLFTQVVKLILDGIMLIPPEDAPPLICELMKNCWKTEPKHRITFPQIKQVLEQAYCSNVQSLKVSSITLKYTLDFFLNL